MKFFPILVVAALLAVIAAPDTDKQKLIEILTKLTETLKEPPRPAIATSIDYLKHLLNEPGEEPLSSEASKFLGELEVFLKRLENAVHVDHLKAKAEAIDHLYLAGEISSVVSIFDRTAAELKSRAEKLSEGKLSSETSIHFNNLSGFIKDVKNAMWNSDEKEKAQALTRVMDEHRVPYPTLEQAVDTLNSEVKNLIELRQRAKDLALLEPLKHFLETLSKLPPPSVADSIDALKYLAAELEGGTLHSQTWKILDKLEVSLGKMKEMRLDIDEFAGIGKLKRLGAKLERETLPSETIKLEVFRGEMKEATHDTDKSERIEAFKRLTKELEEDLSTSEQAIVELKSHADEQRKKRPFFYPEPPRHYDNLIHFIKEMKNALLIRNEEAKAFALKRLVDEDRKPLPTLDKATEKLKYRMQELKGEELTRKESNNYYSLKSNLVKIKEMVLKPEKLAREIKFLKDFIHGLKLILPTAEESFDTLARVVEVLIERPLTSNEWSNIESFKSSLGIFEKRKAAREGYKETLLSPKEAEMIRKLEELMEPVEKDETKQLMEPVKKEETKKLIERVKKETDEEFHARMVKLVRHLRTCIAEMNINPIFGAGLEDAIHRIVKERGSVWEYSDSRLNLGVELPLAADLEGNGIVFGIFASLKRDYEELLNLQETAKSLKWFKSFPKLRITLRKKIGAKWSLREYEKQWKEKVDEVNKLFAWMALNRPSFILEKNIKQETIEDVVTALAAKFDTKAMKRLKKEVRRHKLRAVKEMVTRVQKALYDAWKSTPRRER